MAVTRPRPVGGATRFAGIDQGIDYTGPGPVYAVTSGVITRDQASGSGWPGQGGLLTYWNDKLRKGVYVAEDFVARAGLRVGSKVKAGELIGQATGSNQAPGIEMGWADQAGHPVAPLDPANTHGQTAAGQDFAAFVGAARPRGGTQTPAGPAADLAALWERAGGPSTGDLPAVMAAIALAESSGNPNARNVDSNGTVDRGLWQINSSNFDSDSLFNPQTNAKWAVKVYNRQGLNAWTTYKTGAYKKYLPGASAPTPTASVARTRPGDSGNGPGDNVLSWIGAAADGPFTLAEKEFSGLFGLGLSNPLDVFKGLVWLMNPRSWLRVVEFLTGMVLMLLGLTGLAVVFLQRSSAVGKAASVASALPGPAGAAGRAVTLVRTPRSSARRHAQARERRERARLNDYYQQNADELDPRRRARSEQRELREQASREARDNAQAVRESSAERRASFGEVPF